MTDKALRLEMGHAGRRFALERYRFEDQAEKLGEILFAAAKDGNGRPRPSQLVN